MLAWEGSGPGRCARRLSWRQRAPGKACLPAAAWPGSHLQTNAPPSFHQSSLTLPPPPTDCRPPPFTGLCCFELLCPSAKTPSPPPPSPTPLLSGVYFERYVKGKFAASLWHRNIQLGLYGVPLSIGYALAKDGRTMRAGGVLQGFDRTAWLVIALQIAGGLLVGMVVKYCDNIL